MAATKLACQRPAPKSLKKKKEIKVRADFKHKTRSCPKRSQLPHNALLLAKEVYCSGSVLTSWLHDKFKGGSADKQKYLRKTPKPIIITNRRMWAAKEFQRLFPRNLSLWGLWDDMVLFNLNFVDLFLRSLVFMIEHYTNLSFQESLKLNVTNRKATRAGQPKGEWRAFWNQPLYNSLAQPLAECYHLLNPPLRTYEICKKSPLRSKMSLWSGRQKSPRYFALWC